MDLVQAYSWWFGHQATLGRSPTSGAGHCILGGWPPICSSIVRLYDDWIPSIVAGVNCFSTSNITSFYCWKFALLLHRLGWLVMSSLPPLIAGPTWCCCWPSDFLDCWEHSKWGGLWRGARQLPTYGAWGACMKIQLFCGVDHLHLYLMYLNINLQAILHVFGSYQNLEKLLARCELLNRTR